MLQRNSRSFSSDARGQNVTLSYAIVIGLSALILIGLTVGTNTLIDNQTDSITESELRVIGERLGAQMASADNLANADSATENIVIESGVPEEIVGTSYEVTIQNRAGIDTVLIIESLETNQKAAVLVKIETQVQETTVSSSSGINVVVKQNGSGTEVVTLEPG